MSTTFRSGGLSTSTFGQWLRQQRKLHDLIQEELAMKIDCSWETVRKFEAGTRHPSKQVAELLADLFDIPTEYRAGFIRFARSDVGGERFASTNQSHINIEPRHPANNLPAQPNVFVGREREIREVAAVVLRSDVRLITLTGPGGIGKTRLALQAAADLLDLLNEVQLFSDGMWFVELAPLADPELVMPTIAQVLGVKETGGTPILESLKAYLREKKTLLVLDNFEHVVKAAEQVGQLLASCPNLKVMVTSRMPLRIKGEKKYQVSPLSLPPDAEMKPEHAVTVDGLTHYEAVHLFVERALDIKPDFEVTDDNATAVAQICARVDGLPLGIELAAARTRLFSPQALLTRLGSRLKVLTGGAVNLPARQQTLRNTIEWSYELLAGGEKQLFRRMAVFQGGRTLAALEAVCNYDGRLQIDVVEGVQSLLSQSLLQQREGTDGEPRLWMLETIHEYAREKLAESGEAEDLQGEHALYFMALAEEAEPHLMTGKRQIEWVARLADELDNIRSSLDWASEQSKPGESTSEATEEAAEVGFRIAGALWRFWALKGLFTEAREHVRRLLELTEAEAPAQGSPSSISSASTALRSRSKAKAFSRTGDLAWRQGDYSSAQSLETAALELGRKIGDKQIMAFSLTILGTLARVQGDYTAARTLYEETLALNRELGDKWGIVVSLQGVGLAAMEQGDYTAARSLLEESLVLNREIGDKLGTGYLLNCLGVAVMQQGDYTTARSALVESLTLFRELGDKRGIAISLAALGGVIVRERVGLAGPGQEGSVERGARLLGAAEALLLSMDTVLDQQNRVPYEWSVQQARSLLGEKAFEKVRQEGRAMSTDEAVEYALERTPEEVPEG